jgi:hypothetical protein
MTTKISPEQDRFARIFFPHAYQQHARVLKDGTRFVHYTNANAAMGILQSKTIWMRNSSCMNDVSEVRYGLERLWKTYRDTEAGKQFRQVLNGIYSGFSDEIEKRFNDWTPQFLTSTYLTCLSEHQDDEDEHGRLSMWRAYGETTRVALVIKSSVLLNPADGLGAYSSPVAYLNDRQFEERFAEIAHNISSEAEFLRGQEPRKHRQSDFSHAEVRNAFDEASGIRGRERMACVVRANVGGITLHHPRNHRA